MVVSLSLDGDVSILCIVSDSTQRCQAAQKQTLLEMLKLKRILALNNLAATMLKVSGLGTSRWGWVRGSASETAGPLLGEEVVGLCQGNNELGYPFPPGCPHFMYQNATCRIPSALHSLTAFFPNNRWEFWVRSWRSAIKVFSISSQGNYFFIFSN